MENFPSIDNVKPAACGRLNGTGVSEIRLSCRLRRPNNAYRADCGRSETSFITILAAHPPVPLAGMYY